MSVNSAHTRNYGNHGLVLVFFPFFNRILNAFYTHPSFRMYSVEQYCDKFVTPDLEKHTVIRVWLFRTATKAPVKLSRQNRECKTKTADRE